MKFKTLKWTDCRLEGRDIGTIRVRLPKGEYLIGFMKVDRDKWLVKSSNNWYWNLYYHNKQFKLQKLN